MHESYTPIACGFYDNLEAYAIRRLTCDIAYHDEAGALHKVRDRIVDLFSTEHAEYAKLAGGLFIRLDRLVRINDQVPGDACALP